jgi:hypothetical protein
LLRPSLLGAGSVFAGFPAALAAALAGLLAVEAHLRQAVLEAAYLAASAELAAAFDFCR